MTKEQAIRTAANWWAEKLKERQPHSNGDNSPASVLACLLADLRTDEVTEEKLKLFKAALEREIQEHTTRYPGCMISLHSDYGPGMMLFEAAVEAGIPLINFPFKTSLFITENGDDFAVKVFDGYGSAAFELQP